MTIITKRRSSQFALVVPNVCPQEEICAASPPRTDAVCLFVPSKKCCQSRTVHVLHVQRRQAGVDSDAAPAAVEIDVPLFSVNVLIRREPALEYGTTAAPAAAANSYSYDDDELYGVPQK